MPHNKIFLSFLSFLVLSLFFCSYINAESSTSLPEDVVYEILGQHSSLSEQAFARMLKWRKEVRELTSRLGSKQIIINDTPNSNSVYLTFDDGPDSIITPSVVDILLKNGASGNFFFTGENIKKYPDVVKKVIESNNFVAGHTFSHTKLTDLSEEEIEKEIIEANNLIEKITGNKPVYFRPPYGAINDNVINISQKLNLKIILWSLDTLDWANKESNVIIKNVEENLRPGEIILMHSNSDRSETCEALGRVIKLIKSKGYKIEVFK